MENDLPMKFASDFYLYGDLLYDIVMFKERNLAIVKTHQLKKSSGFFETIQERKIEFQLHKSRLCDKCHLNQYVDDRYCIVDWEYFLSGYLFTGLRHIEVRCINTLELIHDRDFGTAARGKEKGYKGGIILVRSEQSNHSIIAWDVHNNRITPINYFQNYYFHTSEDWKNLDVLYCDGIQVFGSGGAEELIVTC